MMTILFILTGVLFVTGATCSPVIEASSSLDRPQLSSDVYRPSLSLSRRYLYGHLLTEPYDAEYSTDDIVPVKRSGNGAWIWMPAQGYVSVSKSQQASTGDVSGKHGRIMRYGK